MESGLITDAQITASSVYSGNHAAHHGRLNFKSTGSVVGAWVAGTSNSNQWLQIHLGEQHPTVAAVATQGRDLFHQRVTKYRLQFSDNTSSFHYYMEDDQVTEKVGIVVLFGIACLDK